MPWLSLITFLPILGAALVALVPSSMTRLSALGVSLVVLAASLPLWFGYDPVGAPWQFEEKYAWIPAFGVNYHVGIDGVSLLLILLTTVLTPIIVLSGFTAVEHKERGYYPLMLALEGAMIGTFTALDTFQFYMFWEIVLMPMYLLIGVWGGENRIYATLKLFIYTVTGSLIMLVALMWMCIQYNVEHGRWSTDLLDLMAMDVPFDAQWWLFGAFALAFAIKVPLFPLHTWLPDAHVQAPTGGSVVLAGVMLKMGTYGFYRIAIPLFPAAAVAWGPTMMWLSAIAVVYGALVAMVQDDIKKLVAYSSVSHMGAVMLGLFAFTAPGMTGSVYQMLNHGVSTGALFLLVGVLYERRHTRLISEYGGLSAVVPWFAVVFLIVTFSSIGLPGLNGFVGEFLILLGAFKYAPMQAALATTGVIFGAVYMLWAYQRMMFGPLQHHENKALKDLSAREAAYLLPLVALIFIMGLFPQPFLDRINPSVDALVARVQQHYDASPYHDGGCLPGWLAEMQPAAQHGTEPGAAQHGTEPGAAQHGAHKGE